MSRPKFVLLLVALGAPAHAARADDPVRAALDEAKAAYRAAVDTARDEVVAALRRKEDEATKAGDLKGVERARAEIDGFARGLDPSLVPTRGYEDAVRKARAKLEDAYKAARKAYTQAGQIDEARAVDAELAELQRARGPGGAPAAGRAPVPAGTDPAARHRLRDALDGTAWKWADPKVRSGWFRLNPDGTATAGWHAKACLWAVASATTIKVQLTSEREVQELRVDLAAGTLTDVRTKEVYHRLPPGK